MNEFYEYLVVDKAGKGAVDQTVTREDARESKRYMREVLGMDCKIIQRQYTLTQEKVVR